MSTKLEPAAEGSEQVEQSQPYCRNRINCIDALQLEVSIQGKSVTARFVELIEFTMKLLAMLGFRGESLVLANRDEVATAVDYSLPEWWPERQTGQNGLTAFPLNRLIELVPLPLDYTATQPVGSAVASKCGTVILGVGLSRYQRRLLASANGRTVQVIDGSSTEFAGPGNWEMVFRSSRIVVVSAEAARQLTASATTDEAATVLLEMAAPRTVFLLLDKQQILYLFSGTCRILPFNQDENPENPDSQRLMAMAAVAAVALQQGRSADEIAQAAVGYLSGTVSGSTDSELTVDQLIEEGEVVLADLAKLKAKKKSLVGVVASIVSASVSIAILLVFLLPRR